MARAKRHTHKYYRADFSFGKAWTCALSDCTHYMPRHLEEMMFGKDTICWGCGDRFQFDENALEMDKPECLDCRSAKKAGVTKEEYLEFQSRVMDKLNGAFEYKPLLPKVMADLKPKE